MAWAKIAGGAYLQRTPIVLPSDHWAQVDVWVPAGNLTACRDGDLFGESAYLLLAADGIFLVDNAYPNADWRLETDYGTITAAGITTNATHTIKYHYSSGTVTWYVDGTLVATDTRVNLWSQLYLGWGNEGCSCETYYFTNVKVGTTNGGTDIFSDDFSGGLGAWTIQGTSSGGAAATVAAPSSSCPQITLSPTQGGPGETVRIVGSGFAPSSPLTLRFGDLTVAFTAATSDSSGNVTGTFTVPHDPVGSSTYPVTLSDTAAGIASANFMMCWPKAGDGISSSFAPILATAGIPGGSILGYIHHDGAHWICWADPSALTNNTTFPPPANHTLNMTMVTDDGHVVVTYQLDTDYAWGFGSGDVAFHDATRWSKNLYFQSWSKPVIDLKLASDGTTIWVALLTRESVIYPWISTDDGDSTYPSQIAQFVDLPTLTSNFTNFATSADTGYFRYYHDTSGFAGLFYSPNFPTSDGGDHGFGYWNPPRVVMFAGDSGGFTRIGTMDAKYCPGDTDGTSNATSGVFGIPLRTQKAPLGTFISGLSLAASLAEPGVCHLVWSEGGDWGPVGRGSGTTIAVWDGGPPDRSYRVGYSKWSAGGKTSEVDLFTSHVDRSEWFYEYDFNTGAGAIEVGYSWPDQADLAATCVHALRNDHGSPILFLSQLRSVRNPPGISSEAGIFPPAPPDPAGRPWLDNALVYAEPTVRMYSLSGGGAALLQQITSDLLPTEAECEFFYNPSRNLTPQTPDVLNGGLLGYNNDSGLTLSGNSLDRALAVSLVYQDPLLSGAPVYLLAVPWSRQGGTPMRALYRVRADGSAPFEFLDGIRQLEFSILDEAGAGRGFGPTFGSSDFYSDPHNIWCPNAHYNPGGFGVSTSGVQYDRVCANAWLPYTLNPAAAEYATVVPGVAAPGFYHDTGPDTISYVTAAILPTGGISNVALFSVVDLHVCRGCNPCPCLSTGLHAFLRFAHNR